MSKDQISEQPAIFKLHRWLVFIGIIVLLIGIDIYFSGLKIDILFLAGSLVSFSIAYLLAGLSIKFSIKNEITLPLVLLFIFISIYFYGLCSLYISPVADIIPATIVILSELEFTCKFIKVLFSRKKKT